MAAGTPLHQPEPRHGAGGGEQQRRQREAGLEGWHQTRHVRCRAPRNAGLHRDVDHPDDERADAEEEH